MKIKEILYQNRRDFSAIYVCHCGHEVKAYGYDDEHFHKNVIPSLVCAKCGQTAKDATEEYRPLTTKYEEWRQA